MHKRNSLIIIVVAAMFIAKCSASADVDLYKSIKQIDVQKVEQALSDGANPNAKYGPLGKTPLMLAIEMLPKCQFQYKFLALIEFLRSDHYAAYSDLIVLYYLMKDVRDPAAIANRQMFKKFFGALGAMAILFCVDYLTTRRSRNKIVAIVDCLLNHPDIDIYAVDKNNETATDIAMKKSKEISALFNFSRVTVFTLEAVIERLELAGIK